MEDGTTAFKESKLENPTHTQQISLEVDLTARMDVVEVDITALRAELYELKEIQLQMLRNSKAKEEVLQVNVAEAKEKDDGSAPQEANSITYDDNKTWTDEVFHVIGETSWEAMLVAGTPYVGFAGSAFLMLGLAINVSCQFLFCIIAYWQFGDASQATFYRGAESAARRWRLAEAHSLDLMDTTKGNSFAARVCGRDDTLVYGSLQRQVLGELEAYERGLVFDLPQGVVLTGMCLVLWYFTVATELNASWDMLVSICSMPRARRTKFVRNGDDVVSVVTMSSPRKVCLIVVCIVRLYLAGWLLVTGGMWLSVTSNLGEMILNAVALAFVMELDELVYATLAPVTVKTLVSKLAPIKCGRFHHGPIMYGLALRGPLVLLVGVVYCATFIGRNVMPMVDTMTLVNQTMCSGNLNFVVERNIDLGFAVVVPTPRLYDESRETLLEQVARKFTTDPYLSNENVFRAIKEDHPAMLAKKANSEFEFFHELQRTSNSYTGRCEDLLRPDRNGSGHILVALQSDVEFPVRKCEDLLDLCNREDLVGKRVRTYCSSSCQCGTNRGKIWRLDGCLPMCMVYREKELSTPPHTGNVAPVDFLLDCYDNNFLWKQENMTALDFKNWATAAFGTYELPADIDNYLEIVEHWVNDPRKGGCNLLTPWNTVLDDPYNLKDAMCGRIKGSGHEAVPGPALTYKTFRYVCPVSCGCSLDWSNHCPRTCREGARIRYQHPCVDGLCPASAGTRLKPGAIQDTRYQRYQWVNCTWADEYMKQQGDILSCSLLSSTMAQSCCV